METCTITAAATASACRNIIKRDRLRCFTATNDLFIPLDLFIISHTTAKYSFSQPNPLKRRWRFPPQHPSGKRLHKNDAAASPPKSRSSSHIVFGQLSKLFLLLLLSYHNTKIYDTQLYVNRYVNINTKKNPKFSYFKEFWTVRLTSYNRGREIRTPIDGFGDRCSAIELYPYITKNMYLENRIYPTSIP